MRVLYPDVHVALQRLLRRIGYTVIENEGGCCGALHAHNGMLGDANQKVDTLAAALPKDVPLIVDSAGCGSWLKDPSGRASVLASRVFDAAEFLHANGLLESLKTSPGLNATATYHDACHLAHGQRIRHEPRDLIQNVPRLKFVELTESDMCCGSAGVYNLTQPGYARRLLDRKWANVEASGAEILATGNPGCHSWIQQASDEHGRKVRVVHTLELLESSFSGLRD
jgi:glycolate oxidase iron-sulfur subunit